VDIQTKEISKIKQGADISASAEEVQPHIDRAFEDFRAKAEIKGFRKGKAPMSLIKKMYGPAIESEALGDAVNHFYKQAVLEHNLNAIGEPLLVDMDYKPGEKFSFSIEYEVLPDIELQDYSDIEVEKTIYTISEDQIDRELENLRVGKSTRTETDTVTDKFHVVTLDIQELDDDGIAIIGKRSQDVAIPLYETKYDAEFTAPLISAAKDGEYVIKYSTDHGDHKHDIHVKVNVKKIEKLDLPDLTDDFVRDNVPGPANSVEELRLYIRSRIQNIYDEESSREVRNKIADELVKRYDIPVPQSLIKSVFDEMLERIKQRSQDGKLPDDFDRDGFEAEYYTEAEWQAKWDIIRTHMIREKEITVSDEDIESLARRDAETMGIPADQVLKYYRENQSIRSKIQNDKLMELLESSVKIKEVEPKQHSHH
jgi:trigger factor